MIETLRWPNVFRLPQAIAVVILAGVVGVGVRSFLLAPVVANAPTTARVLAPLPSTVQFVFTSDPHYGLVRDTFRGHQRVSAHVVNQALVSSLNVLPSAVFPPDGGLAAGRAVGPIDFVAEGGDIANREDGEGSETIQSAAVSWTQFRTDYVNGLRLLTHAGAPTPLFVIPGNHDASNALGFYRPMNPRVDNTAMREIFNLMMKPPVPRTAETYVYANDAVLFSRMVGGVHFVFVGTIWPDSRARAWMDRDLSTIARETPVIVFAHDQPAPEAKHFMNPNGRHDINDHDRFENLLADRFADGPSIDEPASIEQAALEAFLARHSTISAYFHGNTNWNEFYEWDGPHHRVRLATFRVDSPMKGAESAFDETRLSFQVVTIDTAARLMTVRECLWNVDPHRLLMWGASRTISLFTFRAAVSSSG